CRKDSIPGTGLLPTLYRESAEVTVDLQALVAGDIPLTRTNLND
ncbi:MAG TPA: integrating conjugative element protein, partial [Halieaceae bacterium]|nr:integrating conjugative element protein [Halieaceae bacterium]